MIFIIYFNGENVDKKFSKEFLNHVCGGRIVDHVDWNASTRKRLTVLSYHVVNKLLNLNQKVVWPDGTPFKCYHHRQHSDKHKKRNDRFSRHRREENFNHDNGQVDNNAAAVRYNDDPVADSRLAEHEGDYHHTMDYEEENDVALGDNWYESSKFIEFLEDDDPDDEPS
ncbi:late expression factor 6 [Malacosoma neustria nucleopolyhedrovirus]|uniref:late expression factor 6 n=1 Tax=Malacosoma neustria nuclear polyhedrosis virus TaxID=38012 RepID=UPI000E35D421|nr:late expression factor 6 [Malacosoma neustria nucleopolyhedrovirus]AUF81560.1 late expression factor 6 [Malacosoma neustria nucleopolyhedrovirus]